MAYGDFKDLTRRTASDAILHHKAFNIAKNPKYYGYRKGIASLVDKFFDKKTPALPARPETLATRDKSASGSGIKIQNMSNKELVQKLHKPIIRIFKYKSVIGKEYKSLIAKKYTHFL